MAITQTYDNLIKMVRRHVPSNVLDDNAADICNAATNEIWFKYDWRETLKTLPPFYLIPNVQDHGPPFATVPSDFQGLRKVEFVNLNASPASRRELKVIKDLQLTHIRYFPHAISYNMDTGGFRVFPRVPDNIGAPNYMIDGTYKKNPVTITPTTLTTPLPLDDRYFMMFVDAIKWAAYSFAGDMQRAGSVQRTPGGSAYSGQLAILHSRMDNFAANEGLELGDYNIAPSEPLVTALSSQNFSIFGGWNY